MPFSSGTYTPAYNFTTEAGTPPIEIATLDLQLTDIATALSNCILRDGTGATTAATPFAYAINVAAGQSTFYEPYRSINAVKNVATQETASFTGTLVGCTTSPTATFTYSRVGGLVSVCCASGTLQATSNTTGMSITGLPAAIQPTRNQRIAVSLLDAGVTIPGYVLVGASGTLTFAAGSASQLTTGFTNSGTKGIVSSISFTYMLD